MAAPAGALPPPAVTNGGINSATPRLQLSQDGLYFPVPTAANVENLVELRNIEDSVIIFKIKTSNPDRYIVRPKAAVLHPRASTKVRFILLASHAPTAVETPLRDRFSIESRFTTTDDPVDDAVACWARKSGAIPVAGKQQITCRFVAPGAELPDGIKTYMDKGRAASSTPSTAGGLHTPRGDSQQQQQQAHSPTSLPPSSSGEFIAPVHARAPTNSFQATALQLQAAAAAVPLNDVSESTLAKARAAVKQTQEAAAVVSTVGNAARPEVARLTQVVGGGVTSTAALLMTAPISPGASSNASTVVDKGSAVSSRAASGSFTDEATSPTVPRVRCSCFDRAVQCSVPVYMMIPIMIFCVLVGLHGEQYLAHAEDLCLRLYQMLLTPLMDTAVPRQL